MIQIAYKASDIQIKNSDGKNIHFSPETLEVKLDDFDVTYPWEYEKSGTLLEVKEYEEKLFYNFLLEGKHICIISTDSFEITEEILSFFWDVDVLIITGTKDAVKKFENIEAKVVIPYWEGKEIFLNTLGQTVEEINVYKIKSDLNGDTTEYVNLGK